MVVSAAAAGPLFAQAPIKTLGAHGVGLANDLRSQLGLDQGTTPVLSLPDCDGSKAQTCTAAGITIASRARAVRIAFHLWNTTEDVDLIEGALR